MRRFLRIYLKEGTVEAQLLLLTRVKKDSQFLSTFERRISYPRSPFTISLYLTTYATTLYTNLSKEKKPSVPRNFAAATYVLRSSAWRPIYREEGYWEKKKSLLHTYVHIYL